MYEPWKYNKRCARNTFLNDDAETQLSYNTQTGRRLTSLKEFKFKRLANLRLVINKNLNAMVT